MLRVIVTAALVLTACGTGNSPEASVPAAGQDGFPVTIDGANGPVELAERPTQIVSLSPTATEMLFAIDAGDQVVAVDDQSNFPATAPTTKLSGLEPNAEAVIGYDPDLVVASADHAGLAKALAAVDVPFLVQPAAVSIDDTYAQLIELGRATGHSGEAENKVESMKSDIASALENVPEFDDAPTYYHELDDTYYSVTSETFVGQVYALAGLENIADRAKGAGSGYPQLSGEYIIEADPDLIFLADTKCCGQSAATVAKRPGWNQISAVRNGRVVALDDDVASRWGPRVVEFIEVVADHVAALDTAKV